MVGQQCLERERERERQEVVFVGGSFYSFHRDRERDREIQRERERESDSQVTAKELTLPFQLGAPGGRRRWSGAQVMSGMVEES